MPLYQVFPSTPTGASREAIILDCADDTAAWYAASGHLRVGSADIWQGHRYVGAMSLTSFHARMPMRAGLPA